MGRIRKVIIIILVLLSGLLIYQRELLIYGLSQARGQLEIVWNARPVEEVLSDPGFPDSLKVNLRFIDDIKRFAFDSLGINFSKNYSKVFDQKGKELMFVVTACEPFRLEPKQWSFPIIGTFSYKGFFDEQKAITLETSLKNEGLDTNIRTAGGWSTLGWLQDPILSNMLAESEADFAETIIHELTHGTLFVKDSLRFNENLATFIGIKGAERYLRNKYGNESEELISYRKAWYDRNLVSEHILRGTLYLDSIYNNLDENLDLEVKLKIKDEAIKKIIETIDTLELGNKHKYISYYLNNRPNNTLFMSYLRYRGDLHILEQELNESYQGDIKKMLEEYKRKYPSL
jgi:predicted aminopeptidase